MVIGVGEVNWVEPAAIIRGVQLELPALTNPFLLVLVLLLVLLLLGAKEMLEIVEIVQILIIIFIFAAEDAPQRVR